MANVIFGDDRVFSAAAYGVQDWRAQEFLAQQYEGLSSQLTAAGQAFFAGAKNIFEELSGSQAMRLARAAGRKVRSLWNSDEIQRLLDIGAMQHAPLTMQRWIMAEPTVRKLYQQQRCDGYGETYRDMHPGDIGEDHYDYRRVMNGLVVEDEQGNLTATTYFDELLDEPELTIEEQIEIIDTWDALKAFLRKGEEDPTSKWAADLG